MLGTLPPATGLPPGNVWGCSARFEGGRRTEELLLSGESVYEGTFGSTLASAIKKILFSCTIYYGIVRHTKDDVVYEPL